MSKKLKHYYCYLKKLMGLNEADDDINNPYWIW